MQNQNTSGLTSKEKRIILVLLAAIGLVLAMLVYLLQGNSSADQDPALVVVPTATAAPALRDNDPAPAMVLPTETPAVVDPTIDPSLLLSPTPTAFDPKDWASLPLVPAANSQIREIYLKGLALGNNPNSFSKIGDCNSLDPYFLSYFDLGNKAYNLGAYSYLAPVIQEFDGSFKRVSEAVGNGFNTSAVLSPFRANPDDCKTGETPLDCEYRLHKPSFALISIGTDDYISQAKYEANMRQILDITIQRGIVPILVTKMDNANQLDYNPIIAKLAEEYNVPLINLWSALQPLPDHGLMDKIHPSGYTDGFVFSPTNLSRYGWPVRNLAFLQGLYAVWTQANQE